MGFTPFIASTLLVIKWETIYKIRFQRKGCPEI
jgi:hypothetical protein